MEYFITKKIKIGCSLCILLLLKRNLINSDNLLLRKRYRSIHRVQIDKYCDKKQLSIGKSGCY